MIKLMRCGQKEVTTKHAKFGVNMPKHYRDTASRVVFASCVKFVAAVYEIGLTNRLGMV